MGAAGGVLAVLRLGLLVVDHTHHTAALRAHLAGRWCLAACAAEEGWAVSIRIVDEHRNRNSYYDAAL